MKDSDDFGEYARSFCGVRGLQPIFLGGVHNAELFQSWNEGRMFSVSIRQSTRAHWRGNISCREGFSRR
jgi:hypothetical protein